MGSVALVLIAPFVGSFLGVLVRRLSRGQSVVRPGSLCETCGRRLRVYELVPIVSFLALRGRCGGCGAAIARMHLEIELAAVLVPAVLGAVLPLAPLRVIAAGSVLGWGLLALAWIDLVAWRLPDALTLPLLTVGLAATWWLDPEAELDHALGCVAAGGGLWVLGVAYRRLRGRDGLGLGDVKLLAAGAAWTGLAALPWVLLAASCLGLVFALARHGRRLAGGSAIPFGPAICAAIWGAWIVAAQTASDNVTAPI